jgi:uncharacterized protein YbjQ (UPF0145 family)
MNNCPNCEIELKDSFLKTIQLVPKDTADFINEFTESNSSDYCSKCSINLVNKAIDNCSKEKGSLENKIAQLIKYIPVITSHSPLDWDYQAIEIVTAQTTLGTGVVNDFTSGINDLFGTSSGSSNRKLKKGENVCFDILRKEAIDQGGNAVIGTDIDYGEIGTSQMLMVCMAGTAVYLKNPDILFGDKKSKIEELIPLNKRFQLIRKYFKFLYH